MNIHDTKQLNRLRALLEYYQDRSERLDGELSAVHCALTAAQGTLAWTEEALRGVTAEREALTTECVRLTCERLGIDAPAAALGVQRTVTRDARKILLKLV